MSKGDKPNQSLMKESKMENGKKRAKKRLGELVNNKKVSKITREKLREIIIEEYQKLNMIKEDKQSQYLDKIKSILSDKHYNNKKTKDLMDKYSLYIYDMFKDQPPETVVKNILSKNVPKNYLKEQHV